MGMGKALDRNVGSTDRIAADRYYGLYEDGKSICMSVQPPPSRVYHFLTIEQVGKIRRGHENDARAEDQGRSAGGEYIAAGYHGHGMTRAFAWWVLSQISVLCLDT